VRNNLYLVTRGQAGQWVLPSEPGINYHYQGMILPPNGLGAQLICESMFRQLSGRGKFVHLTGPAGASTDVAKTAAVDRALRKFPNIQLIRQRANADRETARTVLDAILTREGEVDAINCFNDDEALGALATLKERGVAGDVLLAGADAIPEAVDAVIAGDMYATEANAPPFTSGYCMMRALDTANGFRPDPVEGLMQMDLILLDNSASARVYKGIIGRGSRAFDYPKMSRVLHPRDWDPQWPLRTFTPDLAWTTGQKVPKPRGYRIPANYQKSVRSGGYKRINDLYLRQLKKFPFLAAARQSRTGKTVFEQIYNIKL
jgi:ribose transport system substrate-binding protein